MAKRKEAEVPQQEAPKQDNLKLSNPGDVTPRKQPPVGLQPIGTSGTLFVQHN